MGGWRESQVSIPGGPQSGAGTGWLHPHPFQVWGTAATSSTHPFVKLSPPSAVPCRVSDGTALAEPLCPHSGLCTPTPGGGSLKLRLSRAGPDPSPTTVPLPATQEAKFGWWSLPLDSSRPSGQAHSVGHHPQCHMGRGAPLIHPHGSLVGACLTDSAACIFLSGSPPTTPSPRLPPHLPVQTGHRGQQ